MCEAYGGLRHLNGFPGMPPVRPNISLGDSLAGLHAAFGTVMALLHRQRNNNQVGGGQGEGVEGGWRGNMGQEGGEWRIHHCLGFRALGIMG